jgi:PAS domain S-box-containing protein
MPIVYCSDPFEQLTGYRSEEIIGRNCRFLQSPFGSVKAGVKRKYAEDSAVYELKKSIAALDEGQVSIQNYKKGGQPFPNLLTTIPIRWDSSEIRYIVGFQVDERTCFR